MVRHPGRLITLLGIALLAALGGLALPAPRPVQASLGLARAIPDINAVLTVPPKQILLSFNGRVLPAQSRLEVLNEAGAHVDVGPVENNLFDNRTLQVALEPGLPEGVYTVIYAARTPGSLFVLQGSYTFTIRLPLPRLDILTPVDGSTVVTDTPFSVSLALTDFDISIPENRVEVYLDGALHTTLNGATVGTITGLEAGVHRVEAVLISGGSPVESSRESINISAIPATQPESTAPQPPVSVTVLQQILAWLTAVLLFGLGWWLGHRNSVS
ncbi:MAG: copper resistance protein CopC [Anaerolineae bacterium]|nr:copper resistance protein CopC [Anaerolineae bacterium]